MRLNDFGYVPAKIAVSVQPAPDQFRKDMADILRSIQASLASLVPMLEMLADDGKEEPVLDLTSSDETKPSELTL